MRSQVMRAAIYADYQELFDLLINGTEPFNPAARPPEFIGLVDSWADSAHDGNLQPTSPDHYHYLEAGFSPNPHYKAVLLEKAARLGIDITRPDSLPGRVRRRRLECVRDMHHVRDPILADNIDLRVGKATFTCDARYFESYVLMPREWRPKPEEQAQAERSQLFLLSYDNWPRSVWKIVDSIG